MKKGQRKANTNTNTRDWAATEMARVWAVKEERRVLKASYPTMRQETAPVIVAEEKHTCPCCGMPVVRKKAVFLSGHDGRVHGWFRAVSKGKKELATIPANLHQAYATWLASGQVITMKEAVAA